MGEAKSSSSKKKKRDFSKLYLSWSWWSHLILKGKNTWFLLVDDAMSNVQSFLTMTFCHNLVAISSIFFHYLPGGARIVRHWSSMIQIQVAFVDKFVEVPQAWPKPELSETEHVDEMSFFLWHLPEKHW